jgi:predicted nucleic acid-binding protein
VKKAIIDNNVIIDALKPNPDFEADARGILKLAADRKINGFVSVNSLTDIFYVLRKRHGIDKAKAMIKRLLLFLDVISVCGEDCETAVDYPMNDFEDALILVCAEKINADCIITRDDAFLKASSPVSVISPVDFLRDIPAEDGR